MKYSPGQAAQPDRAQDWGQGMGWVVPEREVRDGWNGNLGLVEMWRGCPAAVALLRTRPWQKMGGGMPHWLHAEVWTEECQE